MEVRTVTSRQELEALRPAWDRITDAGGGSVFVTCDWISTWLDHFGTEEELAIATVWNDDELLGVVPTRRVRGRWRGLPAQTLSLCINNDSIRGGMAIKAGNQDRVLKAVFGHWRSSAAPWHVAVLDGLPAEDGAAARLESLVAEAGCRSLVSGVWKQNVLPVAGTWDQYYKRLSGHFRQRLRRSKEQLGDFGEVRFRYYGEPDELAAGMAALLEVDDASWKSDVGQSILSQPLARSYYESLVQALGQRGKALIAVMEVGGEPTAAAMCFIHNRRLYALKTSFKQRICGRDVPLSKFSPGLVLFLDIIRESYARHLEAMDFVGRYSWTERFTSNTNDFLYLVIFNRKPYSRLLWGIDKQVRRWRLPERLRWLGASK